MNTDGLGCRRLAHRLLTTSCPSSYIDVCMQSVMAKAADFPAALWVQQADCAHSYLSSFIDVSRQPLMVDAAGLLEAL